VVNISKHSKSSTFKGVSSKRSGATGFPPSTLSSGGISLQSVQPWIVFGIAFLAIFSAVLFFAWVAEDGYITFRVLKQWGEGHGLRWNIDERVQVFTHPLWMFLLMPLYLLIGDPFYASILLSQLVISAMVLLVFWHFRELPWTVLLVFALPFVFSVSLRQYSNCGLENPLTFLLLTLLFLEVTRSRPNVLLASLFTGLMVLNRLDTVLLGALPLLLLVLREMKESYSFRPMVQAFLGMAPLVLWLIFSLLYYGFAFPNTYYAKLHTGLSSLQYWQQGWHYLTNLFMADFVGALILVFDVCAVVALRNGLRWRTHMDGLPLAFAFSGIAYAIYVVSIGGDFMSGRFFTPVLLNSLLLWLLILYRMHERYRERLLRSVAWMVAIVPLLSMMIAEQTVYHAQGKLDRKGRVEGIVSEFEYYKDTNWLWNDEGKRPRDMDFAVAGALAGERLKSGMHGAPKVEPGFNIGLYGYFHASEAIILDVLALSDPLMARLPLQNLTHWRVGHFQRALPEGYLHARETGDSSHMQPDLAQYYAALKSIVSDPVFSSKRLQTLWGWHWGDYDHFREAYLQSLQAAAAQK